MKFPFILIKPSSFLSAKDLTNKWWMNLTQIQENSSLG
jgi:hypothetical protein